METMITWVRVRSELALARRSERGFVVAENLGYLVVAIAVIGLVYVGLTQTDFGKGVGDTVLGWIKGADPNGGGTGTTIAQTTG